MATASSTSKLYNTVVEDVINNVKEAFLDEGVDEQVLQELKQLWELKLKLSKALEPAQNENDLLLQRTGTPQLAVFQPQQVMATGIQQTFPGIQLTRPGTELSGAATTATMALPRGIFHQQMAQLNAGAINAQPITLANGQIIIPQLAQARGQTSTSSISIPHQATLVPGTQLPPGITMQQIRQVGQLGQVRTVNPNMVQPQHMHAMRHVAPNPTSQSERMALPNHPPTSQPSQHSDQPRRSLPPSTSSHLPPSQHHPQNVHFSQAHHSQQSNLLSSQSQQHPNHMQISGQRHQVPNHLHSQHPQHPNHSQILNPSQMQHMNQHNQHPRGNGPQNPNSLHSLHQHPSQHQLSSHLPPQHAMNHSYPRHPHHLMPSQQHMPPSQQHGPPSQQHGPSLQQQRHPAQQHPHLQQNTSQQNPHLQPNTSQQMYGMPPPRPRNTNTVLQLDGAGDTSSSEDDDLDNDDDDDDNDNDNENDEENQGEEEEPLNTDDDISEEDPNELFDTDNVVVCQYEKINRIKNKWKFHLKDGIMNLNGKDYVFQKASGEAEW